MPAAERKELVLAAAIAEFAKGGLEGTSTEVIARRADISQPYLFRLFPTKKALFLAAVQRTFDRATQILVDAAGDLEGEEAMSAMGDAYREFLADRTLLLTQMHAFAACDDDEVRRPDPGLLRQAVARRGRLLRVERRGARQLLRLRHAPQRRRRHGPDVGDGSPLGRRLPGAQGRHASPSRLGPTPAFLSPHQTCVPES